MSQWRLDRRIRACSLSITSREGSAAAETVSDRSVWRMAFSTPVQRGIWVTAEAVREVMFFNFVYAFVYAPIDKPRQNSTQTRSFRLIFKRNLRIAHVAPYSRPRLAEGF
jgi:hypothetical protein